jgi:RimJ/RimL family protein N-acetyltransferase
MINVTAKKNRFCFKPMVKSQHDLVLEWIHQPHINEWLHGDGLSNTVKDIEQFLNNGDSWATHWIAYDNETPFAYLITSTVENSEVYSAGALTLDLFICRLDYLGKGLSVQMIHEFLVSECSDAVVVFIDPEVANMRAVHVYKKVGFEIIGEFIASWHPVPHYKMQLNIAELKIKLESR